MKKLVSQLIFIFLFQFVLNAQTSYVLIGWNDLGMHCSNKDFSEIAVLPPYNNIYAQLIKKEPGQAPQIITSGVTIEYSVPGNTYSAGKTDFWDYAQQLFNLPQPLPPNIGLTGKGLSGTLDPSGNYYFARGIPLTPYTDSNLTTPNPYQLVHLVAKVTGTSTILATTDAVIPVSNEIGCVQSGCHTSEQQILNSHESLANNITLTGPVLCASCHADNALGTPGNGDAPPFSQAIHLTHAELGLPNTVETCYKCHPGPETQCLRGAMVDFPPPSSPMKCEDCHGTLYDVGNSVRNGRQPWLEEPTCGTCHGSNYATEPNKLFKDSQGHGGLFCSACHGSPHSIWPTRIANDNIQSIRLQGSAGTIRECTVCHSSTPSGPGPHGIFADQNNPPVVSITAPPDSSSFPQNSDITINASASDSDGSVVSVKFYSDTTLLGIDTSSPYSISWNNVQSGNYTLTALATDNQGATGLSSPVQITVGSGSGNIPPMVSITSPPNGAFFKSRSDISIVADASDADGTIASVKFYADSTLLFTDFSSPYSYVWNNVRSGYYSLTAVATDNVGASTTSSPVSITVQRKHSDGRGNFAIRNYPNPFNPSTKIEFDLPSEENVTLTIYNIIGQVVEILINNRTMAAGIHSIDFNAAGKVSGTYICKIQKGNDVEFRKMVYLK